MLCLAAVCRYFGRKLNVELTDFIGDLEGMIADLRTVEADEMSLIPIQALCDLLKQKPTQQ
jgi:hypothetical protein